jgi:hypothetical protein
MGCVTLASVWLSAKLPSDPVDERVVGDVRDHECVEPSLPLFHYTSANVALDNILTDGTLKLGAPAGLNDPFESEPHWVNLIDDLPATEPEPEPTMQLFERASDLLRSKCRLACLSTSSANESTSLGAFGDGWMRARMWAEYADNHAGVCLAFDADRLSAAADRLAVAQHLSLHAGPVRYRDRGGPAGDPITLRSSEARADLDRLVDELFPGFVQDLYFRKAWDWSTETEYRFLVHGDVAEAEYVDIRQAVIAVFLGPRFPESRLNDLFARCGALAENRAFLLRWRNGFPSAVPFHGRSMRRVTDWDLPPLPLVGTDRLRPLSEGTDEH